MASKGKTVCKEVCSTCKCTVIEKIKDKKPDNGKKDNGKCTATIVGVLSLPDNFCNQNDKDDKKEEDCVEVYRDLGECLQKAIVKTGGNSGGNGNGNRKNIS